MPPKPSVDSMQTQLTAEERHEKGAHGRREVHPPHRPAAAVDDRRRRFGRGDYGGQALLEGLKVPVRGIVELEDVDRTARREARASPLLDRQGLQRVEVD